MPKKLNIKAKLLFSVTIFVIALMLVSGYISAKISFAIIYDRIVNREAPASVNYIAETFEKKMDKSLSIARLIADNPHIIQWIKDGEKKEGMNQAISFFKEVKKNDMDFVFLVSANSKNYYTSDGLFKTVSADNPRDSWFFDTLKSKTKLAINIDTAEKAKTLMAFINLLVGPVDNPIGVAGAGINLTALSEQLSTTKLSENSTAFLISQDGSIQAHPSENYVFTIKNIKNIPDQGFQKEIVQALLTEEKGTKEYIDEKGIEKLVVFKIIPASNWKIVFEIPKKELGKGLGKIQTVNTLMTLICIVVLVLVLSFFINKILKPVKETVATLEDISQGEGDLTKRIEVTTSDEIGILATAFNTFLDKLSSIIANATSYSAKVDESSGTMLDITKAVSVETTSASSRIQTIAASAEEVNLGMESVASAIEESNANISMIASAVEQMSATINEISQKSASARTISEKAVSVSQETSSQIKELGGAANEIGKVTDTITDISEQTNLLALNATIEAARAGDAGKGFAVVASEIKELAKQTTIAAQEINTRISGIQSATNTSVLNIKEVESIITDCNDLIGSIAAAIEEQTATTQEISSNISQLSNGIAEVSANVSGSALAVNSIAKEIDATNQSVSGLANSGSQMTVNAEKMADLANKLKQLMNLFKI
ncbi:methyl-accepting chemotaxis protein [Desulfobacter hydrogenophilus]|nr:methyl-accepting chemotaxis protein [Desulfobacter hydrogenophilus]NDY73719.1 methyl-accepting chemotaxis protein [Desulfobacter hydrogenophilus]